MIHIQTNVVYCELEMCAVDFKGRRLLFALARSRRVKINFLLYDLNVAQYNKGEFSKKLYPYNNKKYQILP